MSLALLGKFGIASGWMILVVWMSELYPTEVRLQGIGFVNSFATVGGIVAPYILTAAVRLKRQCLWIRWWYSLLIFLKCL